MIIKPRYTIDDVWENDDVLIYCDNCEKIEKLYVGVIDYDNEEVVLRRMDHEKHCRINIRDILAIYR